MPARVCRPGGQQWNYSGTSTIPIHVISIRIAVKSTFKNFNLIISFPCNENELL
jgi:hypothetical protein